MRFFSKKFKRNRLQPRISLAVGFSILLWVAEAQAQHSITVDGDASDWIGTPGSTLHGTTVSAGEWIYTGNSNDTRDNGPFTSDFDFTEVRIGQDATWLYFLIKVRDLTNVNKPNIGIAVDNGGFSGNMGWIGDEATTFIENAAGTGLEEIFEYNLMIHSGFPGTPTIEVFQSGGSTWSAPSTAGWSVVFSTTNNVVEGKIALADLGLSSSSVMKIVVACFYNQITTGGNYWANDGDCTDDWGGSGNTDAVEVMTPGTPGSTSHAWDRASFTENNDIEFSNIATISLSDASLPVSLSSFTAVAGDGRVTLHWVTESEVNNEAFILERGLDEVNFARIAEIPGQGSSNQRQEYSFIDTEVQNGVTYYYRLADRDYSGVITYHNIISATPNRAGSDLNRIDLAASSFRLYPNFPNPFNPETHIRFEVPLNSSRPETIRLEVYNAAGQRVRTLYKDQLAGGVYEMTWDGRDDHGEALPSGSYFLHLRSNRATRSQKMVLLR